MVDTWGNTQVSSGIEPVTKENTLTASIVILIFINVKNTTCTRLCVAVCEYLVCMQYRFLFLKSGLHADQISCNPVCMQSSCI